MCSPVNRLPDYVPQRGLWLGEGQYTVCQVSWRDGDRVTSAWLPVAVRWVAPCPPNQVFRSIHLDRSRHGYEVTVWGTQP